MEDNGNNRRHLTPEKKKEYKDKPALGNKPIIIEMITTESIQAILDELGKTAVKDNGRVRFIRNKKCNNCARRLVCALVTIPEEKICKIKTPQ